MINWTITLIVLNFLDYITTQIGLKLGAREGNTIIKKLVEDCPVTNFLIKNVLLTCLIVFLRDSIFLKPLVVIYTVVCINNIRTIIYQYKMLKERDLWEQYKEIR